MIMMQHIHPCQGAGVRLVRQQDQDQEDREVLPETQEEEDKEDEGS